MKTQVKKSRDDVGWCRETLRMRIEALEERNRRMAKAYRALAEKEKEYRNFFENTRDAIVIFDNELCLLQANPSGIRLLGHSPNSGAGPVGIESVFACSGFIDQMLGQMLINGVVDHFETPICHKDPEREKPMVSGSGFTHLDRRGRIKHLEFILTDITERKKMDRRLRQSQKIEALGTLAGGVAHDFNNLLMGIQGRVSLMSMDLAPGHRHGEHLAAMEEYIRSGAGLTRQLLGFARGGKYEVRPMAINDLVQKSADMFGRTKRQIRICCCLQKRDLVVAADYGQIEQVLLNIFVNAWQAMPGGGELRLETGAVVLDAAFCRPYGIKTGRYVRISVSDTGHGMDSNTAARIFDPFFTTRDKSRGTGLGLASAWGIVKNHGGVITVYSEPGLGTAFNIYLPLSDAPAVRRVAEKPALLRGRETVLLVDDEPFIVNVAAAMLKRIGYRVITAGSGRHAVDTLQTLAGKIDLVVLDLIMPGMDGGEAFDRLRQIDPRIPILLSSGYALCGQAEAVMAKGCNGFIQKPYNAGILSRKIRQIIDESHQVEVSALPEN